MPAKRQLRINELFPAAKHASRTTTSPPLKKQRVDFNPHVSSECCQTATHDVDCSTASSSSTIVSEKRTAIRKVDFSSVLHSSSSCDNSLSPAKLSPVKMKAELDKVSNVRALRSRLALYSSEVNKIQAIRNEGDKIREAQSINATGFVQPRTNNLSDLKANLKRYRAKVEQTTSKVTNDVIKQSSDKTPLKKSILDVLSPMKSDTDVLVDEANASLPAHERYAHLREKVIGITMAPHYKLLNSTFQASELIVSRLYNRQEIITFDKLKSGVQLLTKKYFKKEHLAKIKCVYPEAYELTMMKNVPSNVKRNTDVFDLVITPNIDTDINPYLSPCKKAVSEICCSSGITEDERTFVTIQQQILHTVSLLRSPAKDPGIISPRKDGAKMLTPKHSAIRQDIFHWRLLETMRNFHRAFLLTLNPPVILTIDQERNLTRWHPDFDLSKIPHIQPVQLPEPPKQNVINDAATALRECGVTLPDRVKMALGTVGAQIPPKLNSPVKINSAVSRQLFCSDADSRCASGTGSISDASDMGSATKLKGLPPGLLTKIRAKEQARKLQEMLIAPETERRRNMLKKLTKVVHICYGHCVMTNKYVYPENILVSKIRQSNGFMDANEAKEHLLLATEVLDEWVQRRSSKQNELFYTFKKEHDFALINEAICRAS